MLLLATRNSKLLNTMSKSITISTILTLLLIGTAAAYWPITVEEDLPVSADPDTFELDCSALPFTDNSTLVVFRQGYIGPVYQIIDRYGEKKYPFPQKLTPLGISNAVVAPKTISDENEGAFISWYSDSPNPIGVIAQRLDSLGNILWGDAGVLISPFDEHDFDICVDGEGGMFLAISPDESYSDYSDLYVQRISGDGLLLWGDEGVIVSNIQDHSERHPKIVPDREGGCFTAWQDFRPPYSGWGAVYAQHLDNQGNRLWNDDLFIEESGLGTNIVMIPDGEGGFIIQYSAGAASNHHWRINGDGDILWERDHLSFYAWANMVPGEPGFFYLGFEYGPGVYGQRMDIEGNNYWPTWGSGRYGALFAYIDLSQRMESFYYKDSYFYGSFTYPDYLFFLLLLLTFCH